MAYDVNEMFRAASAGNVTGNETGTGIADGPYSLNGLPIRVSVPACAELNHTLQVEIQESNDDGSTDAYATCANYAPAAQGVADTAGVGWDGFMRAFSVKKWHRYKITTSASGDENFGAVTIGGTTGFEQTSGPGERVYA